MTQEQLDNAFGAVVRITGLRPERDESPGLEFLQYVTPSGGRPSPLALRPNDLVLTRTVIEVDDLRWLGDEAAGRRRDLHLARRSIRSRCAVEQGADGEGSRRARGAAGRVRRPEPQTHCARVDTARVDGSESALTSRSADGATESGAVDEIRRDHHRLGRRRIGRGLPPDPDREERAAAGERRCRCRATAARSTWTPSCAAARISATSLGWTAHGKQVVPEEHFNLGGKTKWYGAALLRFAPHEFEADPAHQCRAWPIGYDDLAPFYDEAERCSACAPFAVEPNLQKLVAGLRSDRCRLARSTCSMWGSSPDILSYPEEASRFDGFASVRGLKSDAEKCLLDRVRGKPNLTIATGKAVRALIAGRRVARRASRAWSARMARATRPMR